MYTNDVSMVLTLKGRRISTKNKSVSQLKRLVKCIKNVQRYHPNPTVAEFCITMLNNKINRMLVSLKTNTN